VKEINYQDPDAFRGLVEQQKERIVNVCYRILRDREDAQDVAQEVFMKAYASLGSFRGDASMATWLYRIAVSQSLDVVRKRKRKKRSLFGKNAVELDTQIYEVPSGEETPEENQLRVRRESILKNAMDSLPEKQRVALSLSTYEKLSNKEVATIMKTSVSSVESLVHRAKKKMRKLLETQYETLRRDSLL